MTLDFAMNIMDSNYLGSEAMLFATPAGRYFLNVIPWYSVLIVFSIVLSLTLLTHEERRLHLPKDTVIDSAFYLIPLGIVGARIYYVVFEWPYYRDNLLRILAVWQGGLAIYGALIGGLFGLWLFAKRRKLRFTMLLDLYAPCMILSQAIGRWGNYFNQEAYGYAVPNPAHMFFPMSVFITTGIEPQWHYATFFYESVWNLLVFLLLMKLRRKPHRDGDIFLWYIMLYAIGRAFIEPMRTDSLTVLNGTLRISQVLSIVMALAILIIFIVRKTRRKPHGNA